jgi:hypothetical protein
LAVAECTVLFYYIDDIFYFNAAIKIDSPRPCTALSTVAISMQYYNNDNNIVRKVIIIAFNDFRSTFLCISDSIIFCAHSQFTLSMSGMECASLASYTADNCEVRSELATTNRSVLYLPISNVGYNLPTYRFNSSDDLSQ